MAASSPEGDIRMEDNRLKKHSNKIGMQRVIYSLFALIFSLTLALGMPSQQPVAAQAPATPVISLSASCTPDAQGTFTITNIGTSMTSAGTYTLLLNGTPIATNSFQLNAGASTQINTSGLFGTLELDTSGGGAAPATVSTFCQSPTATPTLVPPTISLSASCTPDAQGTFTLTNIGSNMTGPGTYTLLLNGTPIATNTFQLNAGASTNVNTSGLFGTLELVTSGGGAAPATVSTFCQSPTATPTLVPPTIKLSASCTPDAQGTFTITNTGSNMTSPGTWTLLLNGTPLATNTFQLNAGASTNVNTSGLFGTLELNTSGGGAAPATVSTFCQSPTATPTLVPPTIKLTASCTPDAQGTFTITNIGSNMTGPGTWTLLLNGTPLATNSFQLNAGASTNVNTSGLFGTLELDTSGGGAAPATVSTFCQSPTATPTITPTATVTNTSTNTPTATTTGTATNTPTATVTNTPTSTITSTTTNTPTNTPTPTQTSRVSATSTQSSTPTLKATRTATQIGSTPTPTATKKIEHTPRATETEREEHQHTPRPTSTKRVDHTPMPTPTHKVWLTPTPPHHNNGSAALVSNLNSGPTIVTVIDQVIHFLGQAWQSIFH
jgi:hypothetical protein